MQFADFLELLSLLIDNLEALWEGMNIVSSFSGKRLFTLFEYWVAYVSFWSWDSTIEKPDTMTLKSN